MGSFLEFVESFFTAPWLGYSFGSMVFSTAVIALLFCATECVILWYSLQKGKRLGAVLLGSVTIVASYTITWLIVGVLGRNHIASIFPVSMAAQFFVSVAPIFQCTGVMALAAGLKSEEVRYAFLALWVATALMALGVVLLLLF